MRGRRVPLVGAISMDLTTLDVTDVPDAALGDIVTIYGRDGDAEIQVSDVAARNRHSHLRPALRARPARSALLRLDLRYVASR